MATPRCGVIQPTLCAAFSSVKCGLPNMVKVGIVGVSGYSGAETLKILLQHKDVRVTYVSANNTHGKIDDILPALAGQSKLVCQKFDFVQAAGKVDVIFLAVPHTLSMSLTPKFIKAGITVIDLSGDYRLDAASVYKKWYKQAHTSRGLLKKAVYGLPELYREDIKKAKLIANPGCYPTAALLGLLPLAATHANLMESVIIDAKSGVSGAGKKAKVPFLYTEVNENFKAYKVLQHQHAPEIDLYLSKVSSKKVAFNFVPHLLPVNRGILETIYVPLKEPVKLSAVQRLYEKFYKTEPFVRIAKGGRQVELQDVAHTNYCDISLALGADQKFLVITSVIDNLLKGAAGQAVQNMNIRCGFKETAGLL